MKNQAMMLDALIQAAPSIATQAPHPRCSKQYSFVRTTDIVQPLMQSGWTPVRAVEQPCRTKDRIGFQKHLIAFRKQEDVKQQVGEEVFELNISNSHDRSSAYRLFAGLFVLVCSNGLVVPRGFQAGEVLKHQNLRPDDVVQSAMKVALCADRLHDSVEDMRAIELTERQRLDFAERGLIIKYGDFGLSPIRPDVLLQPRRPQDEGHSLWKTFNVVQENLIRGLQRDNGRRDAFDRAFGPSNPINKIDRQVSVNQALWEAAAAYLN